MHPIVGYKKFSESPDDLLTHFLAVEIFDDGDVVMALGIFSKYYEITDQHLQRTRGTLISSQPANHKYSL